MYTQSAFLNYVPPPDSYNSPEDEAKATQFLASIVENRNAAEGLRRKMVQYVRTAAYEMLYDFLHKSGESTVQPTKRQRTVRGTATPDQVEWA